MAMMMWRGETTHLLRRNSGMFVVELDGHRTIHNGTILFYHTD